MTLRPPAAAEAQGRPPLPPLIVLWFIIAPAALWQLTRLFRTPLADGGS